MKNVVQDLTSAGIDWQREKWQSGLGSKFIHQGEKNAAKYADEVIVLSKGVQDYFKETYGRETHFIPNGVNRPQIREANLIKDKFGLKKDSYILFLGRLVPEKGIRYLVEAFKNVKTDKKLVIAGGSSDTDSFMEELKDLAKGDDRILFTGFVQGTIQGQRGLVEGYIMARPELATESRQEYVDDGYSGTSTSRPAFQRLIQDAQDGKVKTIMTQQEVADRANITLRQYQRLESGERNILTSSFGLACRVIEALDMDVSKFYHGDYYLEEELKTTRGKGFSSRKKLSI